MKVKYKGFELEAKREKCMAGYSLLYYTAYRICDGWEMICSFSDCGDTVRDYLGFLKGWVDEYHEDPLTFEESDFFEWFGEDIKTVRDGSDMEVTVKVCKTCARPYIVVIDYSNTLRPVEKVYHQIDSYNNKSGDYCKRCEGGRK